LRVTSPQAGVDGERIEHAPADGDLAALEHGKQLVGIEVLEEEPAALAGPVVLADRVVATDAAG